MKLFQTSVLFFVINFISSQEEPVCEKLNLIEYKCGSSIENPVEGDCFDIKDEDLPERWRIGEESYLNGIACTKVLYPGYPEDSKDCPADCYFPDGIKEVKKVWYSMDGNPYCIRLKCY